MDEQYTQDELDEIEDMQEDTMEDTQASNLELSEEMKEAYGYPEPEEKMNQHSFLHKAAFESPNTLKTTYLNSQECGRPDFPVRFLLSVKTVSEQMLDEITKEIGIPNIISRYFNEKVMNITNSGMSQEGFAMNLNVTRQINTTRKKIRSGNIENLRGGSK